MTCICGDAPEDHSDSGECQACDCPCYEPDEEEETQ